MADKKHSLWLPIVIFVILPLLIILLLSLTYFFISQCLTSTKVYTDLSKSSSVLGVSTFDLTGSKTTVEDNETFNYNLTLTADNNNLGVVVGTVIFNLSGEGRIGENISGPGICTRASELRATCTAINLLPQQTLTWSVPVTAKSTCSQSASPTLTMIATHSAVGLIPEVSEDTAIVTCVSATGGATPTVVATAPAMTSLPNTGSNGNNGTNGSNGNNTNVSPTTAGSGNTGNNGGKSSTSISATGLNSGDVLAIVNLHNDQVLQCYSNKMLYLGVALVVLLLLSLLTYFMAKRKAA